MTTRVARAFLLITPCIYLYLSTTHTQASAVGSWPVSSGSTSALDAPAVPSMFTGSDIRARFDSYPVRGFLLSWISFVWVHDSDAVAAPP